MSEKDPLLLAEGGVIVEGAARRSASSGTHQSSGICCCKPTAVTYLDVSESADEAAGALIAELSIMPREWSDEGGRDARVVDALQRIWSAIASETPDTLRMAPPRIPSKEWRKVGFQVRRKLWTWCGHAAWAELQRCAHRLHGRRAAGMLHPLRLVARLRQPPLQNVAGYFLCCSCWMRFAPPSLV